MADARQGDQAASLSQALPCEVALLLPGCMETLGVSQSRAGF